MFLWSQDRVLLLKRSPKRTFGQKSPWNCPGGAIEFGEHPLDAVVREVKEETGITPKAQRLVTTWADTFETGIQIIVYSFWGTTHSKKVNINEESIEYKWFTARQAIQLETFPNFKEGLLQSMEFRRSASPIGS